MPGTVTAVLVADGDTVAPGDAVVAIEAMKMEHRVTASVGGIVRLAVAVGEQVSRDQPVARVEPQHEASETVTSTTVTATSNAPHEGAHPTAPHQE
jgi:acetyl-CoA/propionyl-CoA carboxylase biotin carboxyl carrier protein